MGTCGECISLYRSRNKIKMKYGVIFNYSAEQKDAFQPQDLCMSFQNIDYNFEDRSKLGKKKSFYCYECSINNLTKLFGSNNPSID